MCFAITGSFTTINDLGPKHILYTEPYRSKYVFSARKIAWKSRPSTSAAASGALSGAGMLPKICSMLILKVRATSPRVSGSPFWPALKIIKDGRPSDYNGGRDYRSLKREVETKLNPKPACSLESKDACSKTDLAVLEESEKMTKA